MATNTQFSIAVHLMAGLAWAEDQVITSSALASSINTSPSFIRRTLAKLSKAGLVQTTTGNNGSCRIAKDPAKISLLDIYQAIEAPKVFAIHSYPEKKGCKISCNIKSTLEGALDKPQIAMEQSLSKITVAEILREMLK